MKRIATLICALAMVFSFSAMAFAQDAAAPASTKPNLNLVNATEIAKVDGMTPELAQAIIQFRQDVGDYLSFEELLEVAGMTPELMMNVQKLFMIEGIADIDCGC